MWAYLFCCFNYHIFFVAMVIACKTSYNTLQNIDFRFTINFSAMRYFPCYEWGNLAHKRVTLSRHTMASYTYQVGKKVSVFFTQPVHTQQKYRFLILRQFTFSWTKPRMFPKNYLIFFIDFTITIHLIKFWVCMKRLKNYYIGWEKLAALISYS